MPTTQETIETAQRLSSQSDRTLFIYVILLLALSVVAVIVYGVKVLTAMVGKSHDIAKEVSVVVALNTETHKQTTEALTINTAIVKDCQTELIRCREHSYKQERI